MNNKGQKSWNKGLTKENDIRIKRGADKLKKTRSKKYWYTRKCGVCLYSMNCLRCNKLIITKWKSRIYCCQNCAGCVSGKISGKASVLSNKKNKKGFFDSNFQSKMAGRAAKIIGRYYYPLKKINYESNMEREFAMNIYYQYEKLIYGKNYHIKIAPRVHIDFFINNIFIEFHPINTLYDKGSIKDYYKRRRFLLNKAGYEKYKLIIIG